MVDRQVAAAVSDAKQRILSLEQQVGRRLRQLYYNIMFHVFVLCVCQLQENLDTIEAITLDKEQLALEAEMMQVYTHIHTYTYMHTCVNIS